jgi:hypothetical protein
LIPPPILIFLIFAILGLAALLGYIAVQVSRLLTLVDVQKQQGVSPKDIQKQTIEILTRKEVN